MKEDSSREDEAAAKSGTFTSARLSSTPAAGYDPRASAEIPGKASVSIQPRRFFKSDRPPSQIRPSWTWQKNGKSQNKVKTKTDKESFKKKKVTQPFSNDEEPPYLKSAKTKAAFVPRLKPTKTKPPVPAAAIPIPVFNGNVSSPPLPSLVSKSSLNGNIYSDAAEKKPPRGKSPDPSPPLQLIDLSGDDWEPRSGFVSPHQVGFQNNGNTCYINASLQVLKGMPVLIFGRELVKLASSLANFEDCPLLEVLMDIFVSERKGDLRASDEAIKSLKTVMGTKDVAFKGSGMQDATEFFGLLLSEVRDSLEKLGSSEQNIINSTFAFQMEEILECNGCKESSHKMKSDISMWCDVDRLHQDENWSSEVSVQDLVKLNFNPEVLERKCLQCGDNGARAQSRLVRLPRVFVLYLKRHRFNQARSAGKCKTKVLIPPEICFTDHVTDSVSPPVEVSQADPSPGPGQSLQHLPLPSLSSPPGSEQSPPPSDSFRVLSPQELVSLSEEDQLLYTMNLSLSKDSGVFSSPSSARKRKLADFLTDDEEDFRTPRARPSSARRAEEPLSPEEEESYLQKALEMSKQQYEEEVILLSIPTPSVHNNNEDFSSPAHTSMENQPGGGDRGLEDHSYQLQSVVSHHGTTATSGHYVADVFRHDVGGWIRYDDQSVSTTNLQAVTSGSNSFNGYIVTYLHKPLWRRLSRKK